MFQQEIVTVGLLGDETLIDATQDYVVDEDVQLVCKYFKAFKSGTIDKKYEGIVCEDRCTFGMAYYEFFSGWLSKA